MANIASIQGLTSIASSQLERGSREQVRGLGRVPLWELLGPGQMVELSGRAPGKLSTVARLLARAQAASEPTAWISVRETASFYPPDLARVGVDLAALAIVRVPSSAGAHGVVRAAEVLLRSGAFGLVVVDLSHGVAKGELAWQSRLSGLVRMHDARLVLMTASEADAPSLGPLVALRITPSVRAGESSTRAVIAQRVLKSKLGQATEPSPDVRAWPEGAVSAREAVLLS